MGLTPFYRTDSEIIVPEDMSIVRRPSLCFALDLDGDRCKGMKDGVDALVQAIYMILSTERGAHVIYPKWYGLETNDLYGRPHDYVFAELAARIREALLEDDRILEVGNFIRIVPEKEREHLWIAYDIDTIYGLIEAEGVMPNV